MIPTNTGSTNPCDPISSNCVIWQGPDIPCIDICNGDTISDVTAKLAVELCDLIAATCLCDPDMSSIDLKCVDPGSPGTIQEVTQQIIDYLCALTPGSSGEHICDIPECLWYVDGAGNTVKSLAICEYATFLANKVCNLISAVGIANQNIASNLARIVILEGNVVTPYVAPQLIAAACLGLGTGTQQIAIEQVLNALQISYCLLETAVGGPADISVALSANSCVIGGNPSLSGSGTYSSLLGWNGNVNNLAASFNNMWVAFCDMRNAVLDIQANCCEEGCDNLVYDFNVFIVDPGTGVTDINFSFTGCSFPAPFNDCGAGSEIIITDANGKTNSMFVNTFALQASSPGVNLPIGSLSPTSTYTCTVKFCLTDGTYTCQNQMTKSINASMTCPIGISLVPITDTSVTFSFPNTLGAGVFYTVEAVNIATGNPDADFHFGLGAGATIAGTLINLSPDTEYNFVITITNQQNLSTVCPPTLFQTLATPCTTIFADHAVDYQTNPAPGIYTVEIGSYDNGVDKTVWSMGSDPLTDEPVVLTDVVATGGGVVTTKEGVSLGVDTIECPPPTAYTLAGGNVYLISGFTATNGVTYYIYGFWAADPAGLGDDYLWNVLICCECPVILQDQHWDGQVGTTFTFTPVFFADPLTGTSIVTHPANGLLTDNADGTFDYTAAGDNQTDSMVVSVSSPCGPASATLTVEIVAADPIIDNDTDIYVFFDGGSITPANALIMQTEIDQFKVAVNAACGGLYVGEIYYIGITDNKWLGYQKSIVDDGVSHTGLIDTALPNIWPPSWPAGVGPGTPYNTGGIQNDKQNVLVLAFCNESSTGLTYHDPSLVNNYGGAVTQPSDPYSLNYDEFRDGLIGDTVPGALVSVWGIAAAGGLGWGGFDKFRAILIPETLVGLGATKAANLMNLAALECRKIPHQEYIGKQMTDPTNIAAYIDQSIYAGVMPYAGHITPPQVGSLGTLDMNGLKEDGWYVYLNQLGPAFDWTTKLTGMVYKGATFDDCPA